ncbi:MAG: 5-oxoprolinase subunit PxpA [Flavisolibacter sp.]
MGIVHTIDVNCDMGEGIGNDAAIMPFISSANIACGFHAGNGDSIRRTIDLALQHQVHIGAHPSFRDKENFGRSEMQLPLDKIYAIVIEQLIKIDLIAKEKGAVLHHVKPHGALYNMAAENEKMAQTIAQAVKDFNEDLILYGLSGSCLVSEAKAIGLKTASEVFADRTYQDDGSLTPRSHNNALIEDEEKSVQQVLQMVCEQTITTVSGKTVPIIAETICIHGDGKYAVQFAKRLNQDLGRIKNLPQTNQ